MFCPKYIIVVLTQPFTLLDLLPHLPVAELQLLPEIAEEFHQPEVVQEVGHLFIPGILKLTDVRVQVLHDNGVLPGDCLRSSYRSGRWSRIDMGVRADEGGLLQSGDNFIAHRIWAMELCGFYIPSL